MAFLQSPHLATTSTENDLYDMCGNSSELLFFIDVAPGRSVSVWLEYAEFDAMTLSSVGSNFPGTILQCKTNLDSREHSYRNPTTSYQRFYFMVDGQTNSSKGWFKLAWIYSTGMFANFLQGGYFANVTRITMETK